jgi:hypothetical protein
MGAEPNWALLRQARLRQIGRKMPVLKAFAFG